MVDLQRERSRAMLEASINVVPSCFRSLPRTSLHRMRGAPRGLDHPLPSGLKCRWRVQDDLVETGVDGQTSGCDLGRYIFESADGL